MIKNYLGKRKYDLAIFDLDGVLTETSEQHYLAWKTLADELEIDFDRELNELLKGVSRMASLELILDHNNVANNFDELEKVVLATKKNDIYKGLIEHFTPNNLFNGVIELFYNLKEAGLKIALGSASNNARTLLGKMDILDYFDVIVDPNSVEKGKPDPGIFLKAAEFLGINPERSIGFEDAIAGVKAIKAANMYAIGIGDEESLFEADLVFKEIKAFDYQHIYQSDTL